MELTVATFNIRNGRAFDGWNSWPLRRRAAAEAVRSLDADVIGLQEVYACQQRFLQRQLPEYAFFGDGRNGGRRGEHSPVVSRLPASSVTTRWYEVDGSRFPRIATTATFDGFQFTSTHLDEASTPRRNEAAIQLRAWLDVLPGPHIVVGDFTPRPTLRSSTRSASRASTPARRARPTIFRATPTVGRSTTSS